MKIQEQVKEKKEQLQKKKEAGKEENRVKEGKDPIQPITGDQVTMNFALRKSNWLDNS